jgi:hypothetical protein
MAIKELVHKVTSDACGMECPVSRNWSHDWEQSDRDHSSLVYIEKCLNTFSDTMYISGIVGDMGDRAVSMT